MFPDLNFQRKRLRKIEADEMCGLDILEHGNSNLRARSTNPESELHFIISRNYQSPDSRANKRALLCIKKKRKHRLLIFERQYL